jgi:hypothetical protein
LAPLLLPKRKRIYSSTVSQRSDRRDHKRFRACFGQAYHRPFFFYL